MFEFQIANKSRGRGVQRLLLLAQRINLLGIPALAMLVFQAAVPPESMGYITCFLVRMVTIILGTNRVLSEPTVALGRYANLYQCNSISKVCKIFHLVRLFYLRLPTRKERIGEITEKPPNDTNEQCLLDDDAADGKEAGIGIKESPAKGHHHGLRDGLGHQSPLIASQAEVAARVVASPFSPEHEEPNEDIGGATLGCRIVQVPLAELLRDGQGSQGYPEEVDGAAASNVKGAKPAEEAGVIPEPVEQCTVHEDTMFKNIKESNFFSTILWLHPTIAGLIASVVLGENFHDRHRVSEFLCGKSFTWLFFIKLGAVSQVLSFLITLTTHILIFYRVRELEKERAGGIMVVNYQRDGVTISKRGPDLQTSKKLWMYSRTVVSPKASLISFIFNILFKTIIAYLTFNYGLRFQSIQRVMVLCHLFCFLPFIEAMFSPCLRENCPSYRNRFHVVMV